MPADVTDAAQIVELERHAREAFERVDVLVNNAGIGARLMLHQMDPEEIERIVRVNLLGPMLMTRAVLPGMRERNHGAIISVASVASHIATDPLYSGTKFGVRGYSFALRRELRQTRISVSVVSPGFIRTPMTASRRQRMPGPEVVARAIAHLVTHPRREVVVPAWYRSLIWLEATMPWLGDRMLGGEK